MLTKIRTYARVHKIISAVVVIVIIGGGYYWYSSLHGATTVTKYVIGVASQGTVISSVSGSGQVQSLTQLDVKPKETETVIKIYVKPGDHVVAGQILIQLDTTNEQKALTQAQLSYQSAQISLEKLQEAAATTSVTSAQDAVTQGQETVVDASTTLSKDYQSGFDSIAGAFVDFQTVMAQLQDFVQGTDLSKGQANPDVLVNLMPNYLQASTTPYRDDVISQYAAAYSAYQTNLADYHKADRNSSSATLDALFSETYAMAKLVGNAVTSVENMLNFMTSNYPSKTTGAAPLPSFVTTNQTVFGGYVNSVNGDITNASNAEHTISSDETAVNDAQLSLTEKQQSLAQLTAGPDPLDVQSQNLSLEQQQFAVQTAQQNLDDDSIRSPIDGVVSSMPAIVGEDVPSPAATVVGTGEEAQVTLNEVDAAKVVVGNEATLSFDAIDGLSLAGQVIEIDPVGTVSQGVVNYNVEVGFSQAATSSAQQVKPGMSVTADIVTAVHQNVIIVPNGAIKTTGGTSYVLEPASPVSSTTLAASASGGVVLDAAPRMIPVTLGLADDTNTEITSGVSAGDQVITATMQSAVSSGSTASGGTSALRLLGGAAGGAAGGGGFGGGGTRTGGGGFGGGTGTGK